MKSFKLYRKIRIISGKWKGYRLPVLNHKNLRPTTNFMRETLFNWLEPYINQADCLDCFAGTGALGLEALSRSAASLTLLEINYLIFKQLKKNFQKLNIKNNQIFHTNTLKWLKNNKKNYDLIFIDPPFSQENLLLHTIKLITENNFLKNNSFIYIESNYKKKSFLVPNSWYLYREKIIGSNIYRLYNYNK